MRKSISFIFIVLIGLCSCANFTDSLTVEFINNTDSNISVVSLKNRLSGDMESLSKTIDMKSGETITVNVPFMGESFSAVILYENQKYLVENGYIDWLSKFSIQFDFSEEIGLNAVCLLNSDDNDDKAQVLSVSRL